MFARMSIKNRVIISVISLCAVSIAMSGFFAYRFQLHQLRKGLQDQAKNDGRMFNSILAADAEGLARAHTGLDRLDVLLKPFAAGNRDELLAAARPIFAEIRQHNNITHMYFIEPDGKVLLRVHKPEQAGDVLKRTTFLNAQSSGRVASGLEMGKNFFSLRSVRPVFFQGKPLGYIEVAQEIDHVFQQLKQVSGNEVSLFLTEDFLSGGTTEVKTEKVGTFRILYPTKKELALGLASLQIPEMKDALHEPKVSIVSHQGGRYLVGISPVQDAAGATVGILFSHRDVSPLFSSLWKGVAANLAILVVIMLVALSLFYLALRRSLALFTTLKEHIIAVATTWDLSQPLRIDTHDEIGELGVEFNAMTKKLSEMVHQVNSSSTELSRVSASLLQVSGTIMGAAEQQSTSIHETSSAITQINSSIKGVAHGVESLSQSASDSSSSILEMAASVEEVALSTESLAQSVDEVGSAIIEMAASIRQVGENADILMEAANINSTSIMEMDSSIKEVEKNALNTVTISEAVRKDAEIGKRAVDSTILGINAIKSSSRITSEVIATLSKRAGDIEAMLSVIDDVAAQTNLLALNAAIIAAQAGEHGKGFAVVAGEIKQLAERTSSSTRKISEVVNGVLDETGRAVAAIGLAEQNIAEGEALSRKSGAALEKIVNGVQMATDQVNSIARATAEQAKGSKMIRDATEQVTAMVRQIAISTREQGEGSSLVLTAVERMKAMTDQVKTSIRQQSNVGSFIARSTQDITDMIRRIKSACDEQSRGSEQILPAVDSIKVAAESNLGALKVLGDTMANLATETGALQNEIGRFKSGHDPESQ